jgi:hypothetical protein
VSKSPDLHPARLVLRDAGPSAIVVRPDLVRVAFSARVEELDSAKAVTTLETAFTALTRELSAALPGSAVVMRGLEWQQGGSSKSRSAGGDGVPHVSGQLEVPLSDAQGYWQRARVLATLNALTHAAVAHGNARKPAVEVHFGAPLVMLRDPELHRGALIQRWLERVRQLADLAEASRVCSSLQLRECAAPGPVTQHPISLEQIELRLALDGPLAADLP